MAGHSGDQIASGAEARFAALLQRLEPGAGAQRVYRLISGAYSEPGRHYHTLEHVLECLATLDEVRGRLQHPDLAELALWFHDIVYDPGADDNELRSALLFDRELGVRLPTTDADKVRAMIMATVHPSDAAGHDARFVADIDLAGLARPWTRFRRDTERLRRECSHLTENQFQLGTLGFFRKMLARPGIYLTDWFRTRYDAQARRNLLDLVAEMEGDAASGAGPSG